MTSLNLAWVSVTSTGLTTATTAYTDGDLLGAEGFLILPSSITVAMLQCVRLLDKADIIGAVDIVLGTAAMSMGSDNAAPSISDANADLSKTCIEMPYPKDLGGCRVSFVDSLAVDLLADVGATGIPFRFITRSGHTFFGAVGDLIAAFGFSKDV